MEQDHERSFLSTLIADGRPLLSLTAVALIGSGLAAFFLAATKHFLPHDVAFLGMTPQELCAVNECRIVHFMIHDRVAFGGSLVAIGTLYLWLVAFPLRQGLAWSWWVLLASGLLGFGSFLTYLGYGYLDTWHGVATLFLLPCYVVGLIVSRRTLRLPQTAAAKGFASSRSRAGRALLLLTAALMTAGGLTIMTVGMTSVFVPQDLAFMGLERTQFDAINPRLVPLIAHDRAGFGGGVATCGVTLFLCIWCAPMTKHLWQAVGIACFAGFSTAILIHPAVGYNDFVHLLPAFTGAAMFIVGWILAYPVARAEA